MTVDSDLKTSMRGSRITVELGESWKCDCGHVFDTNGLKKMSTTMKSTLIEGM